MSETLAGVRVVEVAQFAFVPSAGAVLADWGAEVVKVVHPVYGDPMQGARAGNLPPTEDGVSFMYEIANRGKRSIGIDLASSDGKDVLCDLVREADVFLTNFLPPARRRLGIDVDDIRAINPRVVYGRGSALGPKGVENEHGGYDNVSFWARAGVAHAVSEFAGQFVTQPGPGFGDLPSGFMLAGGVAAALFHRERGGTPPVVDVSLLSAGVWTFGPSIVASALYDIPTVPVRKTAINALVGAYATADGRYISFSGIMLDRHWTDFCEHIGREDLIDDPRFADGETRLGHNEALVAVLDETFASRTLDEWCTALETLEVPWAVARTALEVHDDPQVLANGYLPEVVTTAGTKVRLNANPVQFDEDTASPTGAPVQGHHTEEILLELGRDWDEILRLKTESVVQ